MSFAIPAYYTRFADQPPTTEGWYLARSIQGNLMYCYWQDDAFWNNGQQVEVSHYTELPQFVSVILNSLRA
jgi:hypothetical protein